MNKDNRIQIRVSQKEKKEFKARAKEKGFRNMSDFIFWLLKNSSKLIIVVGLVGSLSGCAVFMAMHGKRDANLSAINIGQDRAIVVANLGEPEKTVATEKSKVDIFRLQRGNAPSGGRALGHGALDLLTLGIWEVVGTPIEAMQGETFTLTVEYDENDKVKKVYTGETQVGGNL